MPSRGGGSGNARTFNNCTEAWNAGAAPLRRGDPGYSADLDRDGDGVACEVRPRLSVLPLPLAPASFDLFRRGGVLLYIRCVWGGGVSDECVVVMMC